MEQPKFQSIVGVKHDENDLVYDVNYPAPNKILVINNTINFDIFTQKYAYVDHDYGILCVDWAKVKKDFIGVKIKENRGGTLWNDRFMNAPLNNVSYISWWDGEFFDRIIL